MFKIKNKVKKLKVFNKNNELYNTIKKTWVEFKRDKRINKIISSCILSFKNELINTFVNENDTFTCVIK